MQQATPSTNNSIVLRSQESASPSMPQSATPSEMSSPSSTSTRRPKFGNLNELYEQDEIESSAGLNSLFSLFCHIDDLIHFEDVVKEEKWVATMEEEIEAIEMNDTWELVSLPKGKHVIGVKWVYKTKGNIKRKIERNKARLVVKGYKQQHGRDYGETFMPVAWMETVCTVGVIITQHKWKVYQMDVKSVFLNGVLKEEVYVTQPPGYEVEGQEDKVYRLRKSLYGLKQAPQHGSDDFLIANFKQVMKSEFVEMTNLGLLRYFLGIEVKQIENGIFISQAKYVVDILERFKMQSIKSAPIPTVMGLKLSKEDCSSNVNLTLYKSMIGSLMYLFATRPDIIYAVSLVSRFMETPKETHWQATKMILRYVNGTKQYGILYTTTSDFRLVGYTDNDWAGSVDDKKSMSGYVFHLGSRAISWASKKQPIVSLSITEAEYVAAIVATCQAV
eukprot:PITA_11023